MLPEFSQLAHVRRLEALATRIETPCGPDGSLVWRRWGEGKRPPLVLLHGGSGSWNHWLRNVEALSQQHTVYAADLPGCGESSLPPGARDADNIHQYVSDGIAQVAGGEPVELMAFSFGSLVAGFIAAERPQLVRRLHLVGMAGLGLGRPALDLKPLTAAMDADQREAVTRANMESLMVLHPQSLDQTALSLHESNMRRDRLKRRRISRTPVMIELQPRWRCPVHAIWGEGDVLIQGEQQKLRAALSACDLRELLLLPDAGHWVQYERAEAFNQLVLPLLRA
jgi:pimeloyl-ACP methyl ester carboxylesterase